MMMFCFFMTFVYMPWDIFVKPVAEDREVWFGIMFSGWAAKLTAPAHWFVYGAASYGFRRMRPWMRVWGAAYIAQIAFGMAVWSIAQMGGLLGLFLGLVSAAPFAALALLFYNANEAFSGERASLKERYGDWALVTGASAGLGAEFARALGREGVSVALSARRGERLEALAEELQTYCKVETRVVQADLCEPGAAAKLAQAVDDLEIGILVNNAGVGYAGRFDKLDEERLAQQIQLNCSAPVILTHRLLPQMLQRGRGAVVITGSIAGRQPLPLHGVYSATKAFDLLFGEALWQELHGTGVDVVVLEPGSTATEFQEVAGEIAHEGDAPADVVATAIDALGHQPSVVHGWWNWLRANLATRLLPRDLVVSIARDVIEQQTPREMR